MDGPTLLWKHLTDSGQRPADLARKSGGRVDEGELSRYLGRKRRPGVDKAVAIEEVTDGAVPSSSWARRLKRHRTHTT